VEAPPAEPPLAFSNVIDKFTFSSDSNATDVGDLTQKLRSHFTVGSIFNGISGYTKWWKILGPPSFTIVNTIDKFSFSVNNNASDVGDLSAGLGRYGTSGQSSTTHGYASSGRYSSRHTIKHN
jgi:hypothetical protein